MKVLVFDNYDSFTYNLVHLAEELLGEKVVVHRNDQLPLEEVKQFDKIILSPGPGIPEEAGQLLPLIKAYAATKCILGVCLGHQAIGQAFGGTLTNLSAVYHGVATPVTVNETARIQQRPGSIFRGMEAQLEVGRYHSWVVDQNGFPAELEITATDEAGYIMALQHRTYDIQGVQFHPESVLTPKGKQLLENWLKH